MKKENLFKLTLTALFCAIILAMTFIPYVGYISLPAMFSITTLHVVVIVGAVLLGPARGCLLGTVWGLSCWAYAAMQGTLDAAIFLDPRLSVLPRILVGLAVGWYYIGFSKLFKKPLFPLVLTAVCGTLTNTVLVLSAIALFGTGTVTLGATLQNILAVVISVNGGIELVLAVVLVPAISVPLFRLMKRYSTQNSL